MSRDSSITDSVLRGENNPLVLDHENRLTVLESTSSGITRSTSSVSSNTAAGSTALTDYVYLMTGTHTVTLPTAVGNTNKYTIKCISGTTTIATTSAQTIDGSASATLSVANTSLDLVSNNANWVII